MYYVLWLFLKYCGMEGCFEGLLLVYGCVLVECVFGVGSVVYVLVYC